MNTAPAYAEQLKRLPSQARSASRVEAILEAAAELLRHKSPEDVTMRELASSAGVPTGTIYQFFEDRQAIFQALAIRFIAALPNVADEPLSAGSDWAESVDLVFDAYAEMVRDEPAIRSLWLAGVLDAATQAMEADADRRIAERLGERLQQQADSTRGTAEQWEFLVALIGGLLHQVFADDPLGDELTLTEARRAARAYAGAVLSGE